MWFLYYFNLEKNYDVLKSKSSCFLLNKNINFNKNEKELEMENPIHTLERQTSRKACKEKRMHFFVVFILSEENFFNILVLCKMYWIKFQNVHAFTYQKTQETLHVVTIAMICSTLASLWKFQYFRRHIYNSVEHLWWSFYCENSKPLSVFTKKLHRRCSLGF